MLKRTTNPPEIELSTRKLRAFSRVSTLRLSDAFRSMNPRLFSRERQFVEREACYYASKSVSDMMKMWVKEHAHNPDALVGLEMKIRFRAESGGFYRGDPELQIQVDGQAIESLDF